MRLVTAALLLLAGCTTASHDVPVLSTAAPGMKRQVEGASRLRAVKARPRPRPRAQRSRVSRDLSRPVAQLLTVTGYCYTGSRNAAGQWPTVGTAAANAYPLGTRLSVQGYGVVTVEDRSAPGATDVDLYLGTDSGCEARAIAWGRRLLRVTEIR